MWQNHSKNHTKLCDVQSIEYLESQQIPENNRVVELFDKMPAKQKSYQSAVNNNGLVIFCIVLPSIRRAPSASMKCEEIIVKYNQNDKEHISHTLFKHEFWLVKITQLWHFGGNANSQERDKYIVKINQSTMWHRHPNEPKVKKSLRIPAKSYMFFIPTSWFS